MFAERAMADFLADLDRSEETQSRYLLERVVGPNVDSEFGRAHGFAKISSVDDYRRAVPIRDYEGFRAQIDRIIAGEERVLTIDPVKRFFITSGSTSKPKYVPVTQALIRDKSRAFGIYWSLVFRDHPRVKSGRIVTNFSDSGRPFETAARVPAGSESAYWAEATRATQRQEPLIPKEVARIADPDQRYYAIAKTLLGQKFSAIMALNPSTILALLAKLRERRSDLIAEVRAIDPERADQLTALPELSRAWPELELLISWRSPMLSPYLRMLEEHLPGVPGRDYLMMASEGIMAVPLQDRESGGALAVGVHFYEFIPEEQYDRSDREVLVPHQLEIGREYVVVLSNPSGLYRYDIGDVVRVRRFVGTTPVIEFLHRAGRTCSFTGEKLTEAQVTAAVLDASAGEGVPLVSFTLIPALDRGLPHYRLLVETAGPTDRERLGSLLRSFETKLGEHNSEYASKRKTLRLDPPELWLVAPGGYDALKRSRVEAGASEDQVKQTHLTRDDAFWRTFEIRERIGAD
jgi:hypothetical protein